MNKRTITEEDSICFRNSNRTGGNMNSFWFTAFFSEKKKESYISLGINGNHCSVTGRYDQEISIDEAKDIVNFLSSKIESFEKMNL